MSMEPDENESGEGAASDELLDQLNGGDENIVVEEQKSPLSRSTLVMFVILVIGAAGLYFMYRQTGPKSAGAAITPETASAHQTISTFLSGGDASVKSMEKLLRNTEKIVQQFVKYPSRTQVPLSDLRTNPFRQHEEVAAKADTGPTSEEVEKARREQQRQAALKGVQELQLQSIMFSDNRKACMINNSLYREGQQVGDFVIEKISPQSVIVESNKFRFSLQMQH
jgi:hypothetical protein